MPNTTRYTIIDSPVGPLFLARHAAGLSAVQFVRGRRPAEPQGSWQRDDGAFDEVSAQLRDYFEGSRTAFALTLAADGTAFQRRVWDELCRIPYGETISYAELAHRIGNTRAVRAVGLANGANPLAIVVPCHRVIGANGTLTGYGGGLPTKRYLLDLERGAGQRTGDLFSAVSSRDNRPSAPATACRA